MSTSIYVHHEILSASTVSLANKDLNDENKDANCVDPEVTSKHGGSSIVDAEKHNSRGAMINGLVHAAGDDRAATNSLSMKGVSTVD